MNHLGSEENLSNEATAAQLSSFFRVSHVMNSQNSNSAKSCTLAYTHLLCCCSLGPPVSIQSHIGAIKYRSKPEGTTTLVIDLDAGQQY